MAVKKLFGAIITSLFQAQNKNLIFSKGEINQLPAYLS